MNSGKTFFVTLFSCLLLFSRLDVIAENTYQSPNFKAEIEGVKEITDSQKGGLWVTSNHLADFAMHLENAPQEQAKALAIAWAFATTPNVRRKVALADFYLRIGETSDDFDFKDAPSKEKLARAASQVLHQAQQLNMDGDIFSKKVASYLFDLLKNPQCPREIAKNAEAALLLTPKPSWAEVLTGVDSTQTSLKTSGTNGETKQVVMSPTIKKGGTFASRQSLVKGLLVKGLGASDYAGMASQMNATLTDGTSITAPTEITFNQDVGDSMMSALGEVQKFMSVRHDGFPAGKKIAIAFEEQYSSKDGPSAAVACSLLLDALITGDQYDTAFAVTGDMNADGSVQPVGGIDGKIRGAAKRNCTHVAIPRQNVGILKDMAVINDLNPLAAIQVFSISTFDEAKTLALTPEARAANLQKAILTFAEVQKVLLKPKGMTYLKNSHLQQRLVTTVKLAPNHESAKILLSKSQDRIPKLLSLKGSFTQIDHATKPIFAVLDSGDLENTASSLKDANYGIRRIRSKLDPRARPCADSLQDLSDALGQLSNSKLGGRNARYQELLRSFQSSLEKVRAEYNKLASDPEIQEELLK